MAIAGSEMRTRGVVVHKLLAICALAAVGVASAETLTTDAPVDQNWTKRGIVLEPGFAGPRSASFVSSPSVVRLENGRLRMYVWVADGAPPWLQGRQIIVAAEADPADPYEWTVVATQEMLGPGPAGSLRDRGVGFPYVLPRSDGPWLMYYSTWGGDWTIRQELMNRLGVAVSHDEGLTWQVAAEDILPSGVPGSFDAGAIPSGVVLRSSPDEYLMWYTAAEKYVRFGDVNQGILHIGAARSRDGLDWQKADEPALRAREAAADPYEACLARPAVIEIDGVYHMWLGVYDMAPGNRPNDAEPVEESVAPAGIDRTGAGSYRLEYARSTDGVTWTRYADQPVLPLTQGGFDSTSQTYGSVVDMGEEIWLFYTGDGLGVTGIGLATLDKDDLRQADETDAAAPSVEERLRALEDRETIRELLVTYGRLLDDKDLRGYSNLFAEDGVWEGGIGSATGPTEIYGMLDRVYGQLAPDAYGNDYHIMSDFVIDVDGEEATAWSRWTWIVEGDDGKPAVQRSGHYEDTLVKAEGEWKFRHRLTVTELPTAENDTEAQIFRRDHREIE